MIELELPRKKQVRFERVHCMTLLSSLITDISSYIIYVLHVVVPLVVSTKYSLSCRFRLLVVEVILLKMTPFATGSLSVHLPTASCT